MNRIISFIFILFLFGCAANKKVVKDDGLPVCLKEKIDSMIKDPNEGAPQSVTHYTYQNKTVYYLKSPCCDKFNIVYDSDCNILGYPDGGFTGRGDGKMTDFFEKATDGKVVWSQNPEK
ncbi:MAG TPA: hypothetical protein VFT78_13060 [Hanamia sp.]|nr:hypothetical protein [Hanamia sp.]